MTTTSTETTTTSPESTALQSGSRIESWGADVPPASPPVAAPAAAATGIIVALVLLGLGVVGIRDALAAAGALKGALWTVTAAEAVSGSKPTVWVLVGAVVAVLLGLWFVVSALRPRSSVGLRVSATSSVWIAPRDAARLSLGSATQVPGVTGATASASRRRLVITTTGEATGVDLESAVREAATTALAGLEDAPSVRVRAKAPRVARSAS